MPVGKVGYNPDDNLPLYDEFTLGGFGTLPGFRKDELRGQAILAGRVLYYYQLSSAVFSFTSSSYLGGSLDWGNAWQSKNDMSFTDLSFGQSLFLGADTAIGPLYFILGRNDEAGGVNVMLSIGQLI